MPARFFYWWLNLINNTQSINTMHTNIGKYEFAKLFSHRDDFTLDALGALYEHFEQEEFDTGESKLIDAIEVCSDWSEYNSPFECVSDYLTDDSFIELFADFMNDDDALEIACLKWISERTTVIELFNCGRIVIRDN
jgi:hypothetical protein